MRISDWSSDVCSSDLWMLRDLALAGDLRYVALRYFNVAGADPQGRSGQLGPVATHLIKIASQVVAGRRESISIFGDDYDTPDGTCVRDYIHVSDLAAAHLAALEYLEAGGASRSEEHTSELQSLMRISYAVFCLKKKKKKNRHQQ